MWGFPVSRHVGGNGHEDGTNGDWRGHSRGSQGHFHVTRHSDARDSDGDGFSDALERRLGTDPYDASSTPRISLAGVHSFPRKVFRDSDGDGFADDLERALGTDPYNAASHPDAVLPHHAWIDPGVAVNHLGRIDIPFASAPGLLHMPCPHLLDVVLPHMDHTFGIAAAGDAMFGLATALTTVGGVLAAFDDTYMGALSDPAVVTPGLHCVNFGDAPVWTPRSCALGADLDV